MTTSLNEVKESLEHAIHYLNGILDDVKTGAYTKEQAALDVENLMMTEGLDFVSTLENYSESGDSE